MQIVIRRVKMARRVSEVVVATTWKREDKKIVEVAKSEGINYFRGPVHDVLRRFRKVADKFGADTVVRVTADNPFVSPSLIDYLTEEHLKRRKDYSRFCGLPLGLGIEVIETRVLHYLDRLKLNSIYREHVTLYIKDNLQRFNIMNIDAGKVGLAYPALRLTVDTPADMRLMRLLHKHLGDFNLLPEKDVVRFMLKHPYLRRVNEKIKQRSFEKKRIIFRIDYGFKVGGGHLMRSFTLAERLKEKIDCNVTFFVKGESVPSEIKRKYAFREVKSFRRFLGEIKMIKPHLIINDTYLDVSSYHIRELKRATDAKIVLVDEIGEGIKYADVIINSLARCPARKKNIFCGPHFLPLRDEFIYARKRMRKRVIRKNCLRMLVFIGATDPSNISFNIINVLKDYPEEIEVVLILNKQHPTYSKIKSILKNYPHSVRLLSSVTAKEIVKIASQVDFAVVGSGLVCYEFALLGVPLISVSTTLIQEKRTSVARGSFTYHLGYLHNDYKSKIIKAVKRMKEYSLRCQLSREAMKAVDVHGADRVVNILIALLKGGS